MRLNKFLAHCGVASRRQSEEIIAQGEIRINNEICTDPAKKIETDDTVTYGKRKLFIKRNFLYFVINKPRGFLCSNKDPHAKKLIFDLLPHKKEKLFTVGRLDKDSEGLVLVSNDGELCEQLTHPRHKIEKKYRVHIKGKVFKARLLELQTSPIKIQGVKYNIKHIQFKKRMLRGAIFDFVLTEGKNREIRKICEHFEWEVTKLKRISFGAIFLKDLPIGSYRELTNQEIQQLRGEK